MVPGTGQQLLISASSSSSQTTTASPCVRVLLKLSAVSSKRLPDALQKVAKAASVTDPARGSAQCCLASTALAPQAGQALRIGLGLDTGIAHPRANRPCPAHWSARLDARVQVVAVALEPRVQRLAHDQHNVARAAAGRLVALARQRQPARARPRLTELHAPDAPQSACSSRPTVHAHPLHHARYTIAARSSSLH